MDLVAQAREALGTAGTTETLHRALSEIIRREALRSLAAWDMPDLTAEAMEEMDRPSRWSVGG